MTRPDRTEDVYTDLLKTATKKLERGELESALDYVRVAGWLAWKNPVVWDSSDADRIISEVGDRLTSPQDTSTNHSETRVAFVASDLADHGGHSESMRLAIEYLVEMSSVTVVSVFLTSTRQASDFPALRADLNELGVDIHQLDPTESYVSRIEQLRRGLREQEISDAVLFVDPDDVVAIASLSNSDSIETTLYNHADHVFWLGGHVVDTVIDARTEGYLITEEYRNIESGGIIPLTTGVEKSNAFPDDVDIGPDTSFSVSIGSRYKFLLDGGEQYLTVVERLLKECSDHQHVIITAVGEEFPVESIDPKVRSQLVLTGPYPDLSPFYTHADFILDSVPFGGSMVRLESIACDTPVLAFVNPDYPFAGNNDTLPWDHKLVASDTSEMSALAIELVQNESLREQAVRRQNTYYESVFPLQTVGARWERLLTDGLSERVPSGLQLDSPELDDPVSTFDLRELSFSEYRKLVADYCQRNGSITTVPHYQMDGYGRFLNLQNGVWKRLLRQLVSKTNSVGFRERMGIFQTAVNRDELDTLPQLLAYGFLTIGGATGYPIFKSLERYAD